MIRYAGMLIISLLILCSCEEEVPEQPFSDEKMVQIITDMYLIEATMTGRAAEEADSLKIIYDRALMEDYQIDSVDLKNMANYLKSHPEKSRDLHDKARNRIDHMQKSVN